MSREIPAPASPGLGLPLAGEAPPERADAARNRRKIVCAAARIVREQGPDALTMNAVAHASGIGVGTVYRRFGDVGQLLVALLDERERQLQEAFLSGPPPLGPDAPPAVRLRAFLHALADRVLEQRELMYAAEAASPEGRYRGAPYITQHAHTAMLIKHIKPEADAVVLADLLLAPFVPSMLCHLTQGRGATPERIRASIDELLGMSGLDGAGDGRADADTPTEQSRTEEG
ncbi:TetR/AcrR family transcriptional regulator [Streptomyces sp. NPDC050504]|uniref:TetR/AcrR family transcriptional regulator n=1 Tax=Streptomyces sp. NPDC050504 TaxID=3365618 RepID=UPI00379B4B41